MLLAPAVLEYREKGGKRSRTVIYGVQVTGPAFATGDVGLYVKLDYGARVFLFDSADEIGIDPAQRKINFSRFGRAYTIRPLKKEDAKWSIGNRDNIKQPMTLKELQDRLISLEATPETL